MEMEYMSAELNRYLGKLEGNFILLKQSGTAQKERLCV